LCVFVDLVALIVMTSNAIFVVFFINSDWLRPLCFVSLYTAVLIKYAISSLHAHYKEISWWIIERVRIAPNLFLIIKQDSVQRSWRTRFTTLHQMHSCRSIQVCLTLAIMSAPC
jgi:hypothetical protein